MPFTIESIDGGVVLRCIRDRLDAQLAWEDCIQSLGVDDRCEFTVFDLGAVQYLDGFAWNRLVAQMAVAKGKIVVVVSEVGVRSMFRVHGVCQVVPVVKSSADALVLVKKAQA